MNKPISSDQNFKTLLRVVSHSQNLVPSPHIFFYFKTTLLFLIVIFYLLFSKIAVQFLCASDIVALICEADNFLDINKL